MSDDVTKGGRVRRVLFDETRERRRGRSELVRKEKRVKGNEQGRKRIKKGSIT